MVHPDYQAFNDFAEAVERRIVSGSESAYTLRKLKIVDMMKEL